eukprot:3934883-Rhodomonas_salina.1
MLEHEDFVSLSFCMLAPCRSIWLYGHCSQHGKNTRSLRPRRPLLSGGAAYIEAALCPDLLAHQAHGYFQLQFAAAVALTVPEALAQAHVPEDHLHAAQRQHVEALALHLDHRDLVLEPPAERLQPRDDRLVALELAHRVLAAGVDVVVRPREPRVHDFHVCHIYQPHPCATLATGGHVLANIIFLRVIVSV